MKLRITQFLGGRTEEVEVEELRRSMKGRRACVQIRWTARTGETYEESFPVPGTGRISNPYFTYELVD